MKKHSLIATGLLAIGFLIATQDAHADTRSYPGLACRAAAGSPGSLGMFFGSVTNSSSTGTLGLICPLVHGTGNITSATIQVWDRHPTLNVECRLHFEFATGSSLFGSDEAKSSVSSSANVQTLTYGAQSGSDYTWSECTVPPTSSGNVSHVIRIKVVET